MGIREVLIFGGLLIVGVGCSSTVTREEQKTLRNGPMTIRPPQNQHLPFELAGKDAVSLDIFLQKKLQQNPTVNMKWWVRYQRGRLWAKQDSEKACECFVKLASNPEFPLRNLAQIRANQVCDIKMKGLPSIYPIKQFDSTPWLKELAVNVGLQRARSQLKWWHQMHLTVEKSKFSTVQSQKISLMQEALTIAKAHGDTRYIRDFQHRLYRIAPRLRPHPRSKYYFSIAYDYRRVRNFQKARQYYRKIIASTSNSDRIYRALKGIRITYKLERNTERYLNATDALAKYAKGLFYKRKSAAHVHLFHEAHVMQARAHWTEGAASKAKAILRDAAKNLKGRYALGQIYWLRSRIEEEAKRYRQALKWLKKANRNAGKSRQLKERIRWYQAWNYRKINHLSKAIHILRRLKESSKDRSRRSRYSFWLAKTLYQKKAKAEAMVEFQTLIHEDPISYYGLLAHREMKLDLSPPEQLDVVNSELQFSEELVSLEEQNYLQWILAVGEKEIGGAFLASLADRFRKSENVSSEDWKSLMIFLAQAEDYLKLYSHLGALTLEQRKRFYFSNPDLLFPRPYRDYVNAASHQYGVNPEMIYAIMRQESAFNPRARSHADAFGLLQIIPKVARKSAARAQVPFTQTSDLYDPQTNISLGSAYIRELWDKYNGQFILTVASYNANEKAIHNWIQSRFNGDAIEFIEDIPYQETQGYVKRVLRNLIFYRRIEAGRQSIPFPEWCLENIQDFKS